MKHSHVEDSMMAERYLIALADAFCDYCGEPTVEHENNVKRMIEIQKKSDRQIFCRFQQSSEDVHK